MVATTQQKQIVAETFTKPMTAMFSAAYGVDTDTAAVALQQYTEELARFPKPALVDAWAQIRRTYGGKNWPSLKLCAEACEDAQNRLDRQRSETGRAKPGSKAEYWDLVRKRTRDAVAQVMMGTIAADAKREGWDWQLEQTARKIAWFQAQSVVRHAVASAEITLKGYRPDQIEAFHLRDMLREQDIAIHFSSDEILSMRNRERSQRAAFAQRPGFLRQAAPLPAAPLAALPAPAHAIAGPLGPEPPPIEADPLNAGA
jgi:hypothetical protein